MNRATKDALVIGGATVAIYIWALQANFYERLSGFLVTHEAWQLDEVFVALVVLGIAGAVFAARRIVDLRREAASRGIAERRVAFLAYHDLLTGLPNRHYVEHKLPDDCSRRAFNVVFMLDLADFKRVNDVVGHSGGDELLATLADRLRRAFPDDVVVRFGGDEFLVVAGIDPDDAPAEGNWITEIVREPMSINGTRVQVRAAVGFAVIDGPDDVKAAIARADLAMHEAKRLGSAGACGYDLRMGEERATRRRIEAELRPAIASGAIVPYFQPLVVLADRSPYGFEALARWRREDGCYVPPELFVRVAEDAGLIMELSARLLRAACLEALNWPPHLILAFNFSPPQLADSLLATRILRILDDVGFPPKRLSIEVTETAVLTDLAVAVGNIAELRREGVRLALDDFGTGYSSLAQLADIPLDKIKIDRRFVDNFLTSEKQLKIVRSIVGLGQGLGITTLAEGVENEAQCAALRELGCVLGQGYLFGRPMPAHDVAAYLASNLTRAGA